MARMNESCPKSQPPLETWQDMRLVFVVSFYRSSLASYGVKEW